MTALEHLIRLLPAGLRRGAPARARARRNRTRTPQYASALEARIAVCRRMNSRALWQRIRRGTWSEISLRAARQVLQARAQES